MTKILIKDGGTFRLASGRSLAVATMVVEAGGRIVWPEDATLGVTTLTLASVGGSIIRVDEGATFDVTGLTIPDGTVFEGPGTVTGLTNAKIKACVFRDGVSVTATGSADNLLMTDTTATNLPTRISPAFWVSTKAADSLIKGDATHTGLITQWNDCRGTPEQGYHFATNAMPGGFFYNATGGYAPYLNGGTASAGGQLVMMRKSTTAVTASSNSPALVWDKPITGIKAVFAVIAGQYDNHNGGGALLGSTERLSTCHFYRSGVNTCYHDRFHKDNPILWNAPYYINGHLPPDGQTLGGSVREKPLLNGCFAQVVDVHPLGDGAEADCWGFQNVNPGAYGAWIGECLIYTNAVTDIERRHIENYLMQKWFGSRVVATELVPDDQDLTKTSLSGAALNVAAGDAVSFASFTNAAGFTKTGAGAVYVKGLQTAGALTVKGGTVNVTSYDATTPAVLPQGALLHVDANDDDSFPGATVIEGGQSIPKWIDTDNPENPVSFQRASAQYATLPLRRTDETSFAQPMKVVDYGAFHNDLDDDWKVKDASGWYGQASNAVVHVLRNGNTTAVTNLTGITGVFGVWGTAAGGNQLLGGWDMAGSGLTRDYVVSSNVAGNISKPILKDEQAYRYTFNSAVSYEALSLMNGNDIILTRDPPSGTYDIVSFITPYAVNCSSLGGLGIRTKVGGLQMGELILYDKMLTTDEARLVDAYLNYKWFGRQPGVICRPATVGALDVASGATVNVSGNGPLVCSSLTGAGTVNGAVELSANAVFEVPVNADGMITQTLTISGTVDLSKGGAVRLTGDTSKFTTGSYKLIASSGLIPGSEWTVDGYTGRKVLKLRVKADGLYLKVIEQGLSVVIR